MISSATYYPRNTQTYSAYITKFYLLFAMAMQVEHILHTVLHTQLAEEVCDCEGFD